MKNNGLCRERHFFLEAKGKAIYCVEYLPEDTLDNGRGVILCKPIWGERIRTHRIFTNLANMLASQGFSVVTCDYYGDGNSGGETQDLTYSGMVEDIELIYDYLSDQRDPAAMMVVGLRLGACCALSVNSRLPKVVKTILIEPVPNIIDYLKDALRANLTSQMAIHKKIVRNREQLIEDLKAGILINIDGFVIGKRFWESFESASSMKIIEGLNGSFVVFSLVDQRGKSTDYTGLFSRLENVRFEKIPKEFTWTDWKYYVPSPPILFEKVLQEINSDQVTDRG